VYHLLPVARTEKASGSVTAVEIGTVEKIGYVICGLPYVDFVHVLLLGSWGVSELVKYFPNPALS